MNDRLEENNMPYFQTSEVWMQVKEPPKMVYVVPPLQQNSARPRQNDGLTQSMLPWQSYGPARRGTPPPPPLCPARQAHRNSTAQATMLDLPLCPRHMSREPHAALTQINVWQQNLNKSHIVQDDLINSDIQRTCDILVLQEPYIDAYRNTKATRDWRVVYPSSHLSNPAPLRVVILVSSRIDTNQWAQLYIPGSWDLLVIQVTDRSFKLTIYDIYSDCNNSDAIDLLGSHLSLQPQGPGAAGMTYRLWCGDFNRHHPMWDDDHNCHLFTSRALEDTLKLLTLVANHGMHMALLKEIPTHESMVMKNWTCPDNVFCSVNLVNKLVFCTTDPRLHGTSMDHVPIQMALEFPVAWVPDELGYNFRAVN